MEAEALQIGRPRAWRVQSATTPSTVKSLQKSARVGLKISRPEEVWRSIACGSGEVRRRGTQLLGHDGHEPRPAASDGRPRCRDADPTQREPSERAVGAAFAAERGSGLR